MTDVATSGLVVGQRSNTRSAVLRILRLYPTSVLGGILLIAIVACALGAPYFGLPDPREIDPVARLRPPSSESLLGTDALGRDVLSRVIWGGRVSIIVGFTVALFSTLIGLGIGMVAGFFRSADAVIMRVMDGLMAIPGILLAMALMALVQASVATVIIAITIPEVPRVVRLVRSIVLSLRSRVYIDAARALGTRDLRILRIHILPNLLAPILVQATFICASAILIEAYLSFLGVGTPSEIPSWGNMMADGRTVMDLAYWTSAFPGLFLAAAVLAVNLIGDGLRDALDPSASRQL